MGRANLKRDREHDKSFPILASSIIAHQVVAKRLRLVGLSEKIKIHLRCVKELRNLAVQGHIDEAWVLTELIQATGGVSKSSWVPILSLEENDFRKIEHQAQAVDAAQFFVMYIASQVSTVAKVVIWQCYMCSQEMANRLSLTEEEYQALI